MVRGSNCESITPTRGSDWIWQSTALVFIQLQLEQRTKALNSREKNTTCWKTCLCQDSIGVTF